MSSVDVDVCQDCENAPATHVCQMTISGIPVGPLYVCGDCYPDTDIDRGTEGDS